MPDNTTELDDLLLEHKNKLIDHLHEAYHKPELRKTSRQFYIDLHRETTKKLLSLMDSYADKRCLEVLDQLVNIETKKFMHWKQQDIANFFEQLGIIYRELQSKLTKGKK